MPRAVAPAVRLLLLSFLLLFLELSLIRWTGAHVIYLSYFTNFVLLASFLGIGLGFLRPRAGAFALAPPALALIVCLVYVFPTRLSHAGGSLLFFGAHTGGAPMWLALPVIFLAVALALMLIASEAALAFAQLPPLRAYRYDILGSLAGTVVFALLSYASAPPLAWGAIAAPLFLVLLGRRVRLLAAAGLVGFLVPFALATFSDGITWSPYYAIKVEHPNPSRAVYGILVNGIPHQTIVPLAL